MRKRWLATLLTIVLAAVLAAGLLPGAVQAAEPDLPDWYFLFAIFKSVDTDGVDKNDGSTHFKYTMTRDEVDFARDNAKTFQDYMNSLGVINAHVDVVEINTTVTELQKSVASDTASGTNGSFLGSAQAAPVLRSNGVNLDKYDHVTCIVSLDASMGYLAITGSEFENGAGHACMNFKSRDYLQQTGYLKKHDPSQDLTYLESAYAHELLHFMERLDKKWGKEFDLHKIWNTYYSGKETQCYTDLILNRFTRNANYGTGVEPAAWQFPPRVLRTTSELVIPSGVTAIGEWAFYGMTNLKSVTIPGSVSSIGYAAFSYCDSLENVTISSGVTGIGGYAFYDCGSLTEICIPASVTDIGDAAFWNTGLTDVRYGGTQAQWNAIRFNKYNSALTNANIRYNSAGSGGTSSPGGAQDLPEWRFLIAVFKNVDADCVDSSGAAGHTTYSMTQEEVDIARENYERFVKYMNNVGVMSAHVDYLEIDTAVTQLQEYESGPYLSAALAAPILKANGVDLDQYDHITCVASLNITTGYLGVTGAEFENGTGAACINFRNLDYARRQFRPKVTDYPMGTFVHEYLHFMERMGKKWGSEFDLHTIRENLYTPTSDDWCTCYTDVILNRVKGTGETGTGVFPIAWQFPPRLLRTAAEITLPAGVTGIGDNAFRGLTNLKKVTLPSGVTSIGKSAFSNCGSLESVTVPTSVTGIGDYAFYGCGSLKTVNIPNGVTGIGRSVFYNCGSLESVTVPGSVTGIGDYAFYGCGSLKTVNIPNGVTGIGYCAFYECGSLESVSIPGNVTSIGGYAFSKCGSLKTVTIPNSVTSIGEYAFRGCGSLKTVNISGGVTRIDKWTFGECEKLTEIYLPSSVTEIGYAAFWKVGLTDVYYSGTQAQWKAIRFDEFNSALTGAAIHCGDAPVSNTPSFSDVPNSAWYANAVTWAVDNSVTEGTGNNQFSPDRICTRAEIITFLWRAYGKPEPSSTKNPFTDVKATDWFYKAVLWAVEQGIATGTSALNPNAPCTRQDSVTFQYRAAGKPAVTGGSSFTDVPSNAYYADAVNWTVKQGITTGTGSNQFSPGKTCSRAEIVTFLFRDSNIRA